MALPRKYLAEKSSGSEFKLLSTADLKPTDAVIGPGSSVPGDFAVWGGYDGKTLVDGFVHTEPDGALDGNGTPGDPLAVRVDGVSVTINASNELEATGVGASVVVNPNGALDGDGSVSSPLGVRVDGVTVQINASNELEAIGTGSTIVVSTGLSGDGSGGSPVHVLVDNETIGVDSRNKLEVIQNYAVADGALGLGKLVGGDGGSHVSQVTVGNGLSLAAGVLSNAGDVFWTTVTAASNQDVASNTTPANDNELFFSMTAAKLYIFEAYILYVSTAGAGTPDLKLTFNGPATLTGSWSLAATYLSTVDGQGVAQAGTALAATNSIGTAATPRVTWCWGWAYSTAGGVGASGLIFQWAQNTSGVNATTRLAGSVLRYRQLSV